jgi:hypothetical protein
MLSVIVHPAAGQEVDLDRPLPRLSAVKPAGVRHRRFSLSAPFDKFGPIRRCIRLVTKPLLPAKALYDEPTER